MKLFFKLRRHAAEALVFCFIIAAMIGSQAL